MRRAEDSKLNRFVLGLLLPVMGVFPLPMLMADPPAPSVASGMTAQPQVVVIHMLPSVTYPDVNAAMTSFLDQAFGLAYVSAQHGVTMSPTVDPGEFDVNVWDLNQQTGPVATAAWLEWDRNDLPGMGAQYVPLPEAQEHSMSFSLSVGVLETGEGQIPMLVFDQAIEIVEQGGGTTTIDMFVPLGLFATLNEAIDTWSALGQRLDAIMTPAPPQGYQGQNACLGECWNKYNDCKATAQLGCDIAIGVCYTTAAIMLATCM